MSASPGENLMSRLGFTSGGGDSPIMSDCAVQSNSVILVIFLSSRVECLSHTNGDVMNRYSGEVSLSLSLSLAASGYWPSQALSHLVLLSERGAACGEPMRGSSANCAPHLSGTFLDLVCSGSISAAGMLECVSV